MIITNDKIDEMCKQDVRCVHCGISVRDLAKRITEDVIGQNVITRNGIKGFACIKCTPLIIRS